MTLRFAALAALSLSLVAPAPSFALGAVSTAKDTDANKRCKLDDGPKIDSRPTAACFHAILKTKLTEYSDDKIAMTAIDVDEESYCFCAGMSGFKDWAAHYSKIAEGAKEITKGNTKDLLPFAKFYGQFMMRAYCREGEIDEKTGNRLNAMRQSYVDAIGKYVSKKSETFVVAAGRTPATRGDALAALAKVEQYSAKPCEKGAGEDELLQTKLAEKIQAGAAADRK